MNAHDRSRCFRARRRCPAAGFTLIELLVVIVIIGILAALLLPVLSRAKERAIRIKCLSNVKQFDLAQLNYAQDNKDRFPPNNAPIFDAFAWGMSTNTAELLMKSGATRSLMYCPANKDMDSDILWSCDLNHCRVTGYALTLPGTWGVTATNVNPTSVPQTITAFAGRLVLPAPDPSRRPLVADANMTMAGAVDPAVSATYEWAGLQSRDLPVPTFRSSHIASRKLASGGNEGMLDNSARWVKLKDMVPRTVPSDGDDPIFWW